MNKRQLYAFGEPLGSCVTRKEGGRIIYGGGGDSYSSSTPQVAEDLKPLAALYTQQSTDLANTPWQSYTGQRYTGLNDTQQGALQDITNRANNGSPVMDQANSTLTSMLQGGQTNPYLDSMVKKAQDSVSSQWNTMTKPQLESSMVNSGSFGNSGQQQMEGVQQKAATQQMSDIATQMYGNAYNTDQANKVSALGMAQSYGNQAYTDAAQKLQAGTTQQNADQQNNDFAYQQFQDQQNNPYKKLQTIGGVVGQSTGANTSQSSGK
jgi:hypothetical protein